MTNQRSLTLNESTQYLCELPILSGTTGPDVIDVETLYKQTGMFTYDPRLYVYRQLQLNYYLY